MYVNPSAPSADKLLDCLTRLGGDVASSSEWHLFLPRGMYSRGSGPLLGSRLMSDSTLWANERQKHKLFILTMKCCCIVCLHVVLWLYEGTIYTVAGQPTCLNLRRIRTLDSSNKRPGVFLWRKLLERSWWEFVHLVLALVPKSQRK